MSFWVSSSNNREVSVAIANRNKLKNKSKIYDLARRKEEQYINDYIPAILLIWEGNMDAQYIGESSYLLKKAILIAAIFKLINQLAVIFGHLL